jgi:hypothetical protein
MDNLQMSYEHAEGRVTVKETGSLVPTSLPTHYQRQVLAATSGALAALRIRDRITHTELIVSERGVEIVEVNGRIGGDVCRSIGTAASIDLVRAGMDLSVGREPSVGVANQGVCLATLTFPFPSRSGKILSDVNRESFHELPGIVTVDEVARFGDSRAAAGFNAAVVHLRADSKESLYRDVVDVARGIRSLFAADGLDDADWLLRVVEGKPAPSISVDVA